MVLSNAYTGNLLSHQLVRTKKLKINSLTDLLASSLNCIVRRGTSTETLFLVVTILFIQSTLFSRFISTWFCYQGCTWRGNQLLEDWRNLAAQTFTTVGAGTRSWKEDSKSGSWWETCLHRRAYIESRSILSCACEYYSDCLGKFVYDHYDGRRLPRYEAVSLDSGKENHIWYECGLLIEKEQSVNVDFQHEVSLTGTT